MLQKHPNGAYIIQLALKTFSNRRMQTLGYSRLISVVLWALFFSSAISASSKAINQELLLAAVAYAAVLVVFIGKT
jgi:hypothetical protein